MLFKTFAHVIDSEIIVPGNAFPLLLLYEPSESNNAARRGIVPTRSVSYRTNVLNSLIWELSLNAKL